MRQKLQWCNFKFQYDDITLYLKSPVLIYANDAVVFGTDEKDFKMIQICSMNAYNYDI